MIVRCERQRFDDYTPGRFELFAELLNLFESRRKDIEYFETTRLIEAIFIYDSTGFKHIKPYQEYPAQLVPHLAFMEESLN